MTIDWTKPLVTNTGAPAKVVDGPDCEGDYRVKSKDWPWPKYFRADGSRFRLADDYLTAYVRNASEAPNLATELDAEIASLETKLAALKAAREVL